MRYYSIIDYLSRIAKKLRNWFGCGYSLEVVFSSFHKTILTFLVNMQSSPDPAIVTIDKRFDRYVLGNVGLEHLWSGARWAEGPVWFGDGRYLLFSDIPNNRILRWDEKTGLVNIFRKPSNFANGHTRDKLGRLVSCEHGSRSISRTEYNGSITVIAQGCAIKIDHLMRLIFNPST